ncbi:Pr6Pr family membrane protein [Hasllibacter sp. MH4015]|uniref:Pr6Pr family membrane protein n=1 Tax=Hasllibacter sp. MH4015 TaxID=2854029 RepID=UPI001CD1BE08|nr:Pr6Pr family membrane protein [Hasllibacter sp. MH4015]
MFPALPPSARWTAAIIALVAAGSVAAMFVYNMDTGRYGDPVATAWGMGRFFTILTNILVAVTFTAAALRRDGIGAPWVSALTLAMVLVGGVYHTLLSGITEFEGLGAWADQGLHTVVPIACVLWWIAFAPKRHLQYRDLPMFIMWPCVYVAYALARGDADGTYPYPFMDLSDKGALAVATNLAGLVLVLLLGGVLMVMAGRYADR